MTETITTKVRPVGSAANVAHSANSSAAPQGEKRKPSLFVGALALTVGLVCTAAALEGIFAITGLGEDEYIRPDPYFGVAHIEGKNVTFKAEGFSRGKMSSVGLRDDEHTIAKAPGVERVAFLGDSKTEGLQVPQEETFVKLFETAKNRTAGKNSGANLNEMPSNKTEAINFATAGNGTLVELLHYLQVVKKYKPDNVILIYNYGDSGESGQSGAVNNLLARPSASFTPEGNLQISYDALDKWLASDNTRFKYASQWLRKNSRLFQLGTDVDFAMQAENKVYASLFNEKVIKPATKLLSTKSDNYWQGSTVPASRETIEKERAALLAEVYRLDKIVSHDSALAPRAKSLDDNAKSIEALGFAAIDQEHHRNMELTARLIRILNQACLENGSKLTIVTLPAPDNCTFYFWETRALEALAASQKAKNAGFQVITCQSRFPKLQAMEANPYYYTAHFSPVGHKIIADIILESMKSGR